MSEARYRAIIAELLKVHEPAIRKAFLEAINDARLAVNLQDVINALVRGDLAGAARAINFGRAFLQPLDEAIRAAYIDSGRNMLDLLMVGKPRDLTLVVRFDAGNPRAAAWLSEKSSTLVVELLETQRVATREALARGMNAGIHPRTVALDVVGRMDKVSKRRVGGVVGLTSQQAGWVANMREELADPERMTNYFSRKLRDKRSDALVRRALKAGKPVPAADINKIAGRYSDRLLKDRGESIARTEALTALSHSQDEADRQLLEVSGLRQDQIVSTWRVTRDGRERDTHASLGGQKRTLGEPFVSPSGARMRFPRDRSLGAGAAEIIKCRCFVTKQVDWKGRGGAGGSA